MTNAATQTRKLTICWWMRIRKGTVFLYGLTWVENDYRITTSGKSNELRSPMLWKRNKDVSKNCRWENEDDN